MGGKSFIHQAKVKGVKGWNANFHVYRDTKTKPIKPFSPVLKNDTLPALTNFQKRQGRLFNAPKRNHEFVKEFSSKHQGPFQKVLHLFEKVLSSV